MPIEKKILNQIIRDKVHICNGHFFHGHILCVDGENILVQSYNSFPLGTDCLCCFIEDINWRGLPQMSHSKGFFHMVSFQHELIQYAYWKKFLIKSFMKKFTFKMCMAFMDIFFVLMERRFLFKAIIHFHYGQIVYVVS